MVLYYTDRVEIIETCRLQDSSIFSLFLCYDTGQRGVLFMMGERIALLRRGMGWSQSELAKRLKISSSAVGMYEQGRREPSLEAVVEIAAAFGVSTDYLLTGKPLSSADEQIMQKTLITNLQTLDKHMGSRRGGLSKEELSVLFAAVLTET